MSSTAESPDGGMVLQSHYSLRWNNHQTHILQAFEALLHAEILVDVTLVCSDSSLRAHKVVLSACSPFFERIFAEHPCKHPVIVLKDFTGREVAALIDFMYRGEVRVGREELSGLMRAAESLQVRGLAASEPRPASPPATPIETDDHHLLGDDLTPEIRQESPSIDDTIDEVSNSREFRERLPHMGHLNFALRELRLSCGSPLMPRRKQARPRRRSGELIPQDLSRPHPPSSLSPPALSLAPQSLSSEQEQPMAENLSMKRSPSLPTEHIKTESEAASSPRGSPLTGTSLHNPDGLADLPTGMPASTLSLTPPHHHSEYLTSLGQLAAQWLPAQAPMPREASPQAHRSHYHTDAQRAVAVFPMDATPMGHGPLFPPGPLDRGSLLADLHDSFKPEALHGLFSASTMPHHSNKKLKKHRDSLRKWTPYPCTGMPMRRPKGQHSAPRGGPPRSWTNAELTEALQKVWNKQMTTSQASREYGIPYNSLLMYVRGKYGKSLKLEQLRRDCTGATAGEVMNSLNNNVKAIQAPSRLSHPLAGLGHPADDFSHHPLLGPNLGQGFFPDFGAAFPVPVSMVHLLPPSEQKAFDPGNSAPLDRGSASVGNPGDLGSSRSPSPSHEGIPQPPQSAPALLQQNGE